MLDNKRQVSMTRCCMIASRGDEPFVERESRGNGTERVLERRGIERGVDDRDDDLVLVGEDAKDGALGDAGRFGDLAAS